MLAPHIASWISPQVAITVSKIVNDNIIDDFKNQLIEKDSVIHRLEQKIDSMWKELST
jgi:hypothetical protein